jgi:ADP-ribose pyrophosphatase
MGLTETLIRSDRIFEGKILNLRVDTVALPDGRETTREIIEHNGAVAMVPITETGEVVLVRQYRRAPDEVILEIPAGRLEPGEQPEECARRELAEEIGQAPAELRKISELYSAPGYSQEKMHLFIARGLKTDIKRPDSDEFLEVVAVPLAEAVRKCLDGEIRDVKTAAGIMIAAEVLRAGQ